MGKTIVGVAAVSLDGFIADDKDDVGPLFDWLGTGDVSWTLRPITYNRMVVDELTDEEVDRVFHALADGTRRDIVRRCARGDSSVSRLADVYPMSFAAVQKHVVVLERAGLVTKERRGREQLVRTNGDGIGRARRVLDELEAAWRGRVERMADLLGGVPEADPDELSTRVAG
jgi:DNA-binding transcriptional ArsR family regulator